MTDVPKIYFANLAAYNSGKLRWIWIDATEKPDGIHAEVQAMLAGSPGTEWASFEEVHDIALLIEGHGALGAELLSHWNNDLEEVRHLFDNDQYLSAFDSVADYAEEITEVTVKISEPLQFHIDFQSMARDMELNGDVFTVEQGGQVRIFINH